jgi:hypothetical protein
LDYIRDEQLAHKFFENSRREGEFFEINPEAVQQFFASKIAAQYQKELLEQMQVM